MYIFYVQTLQGKVISNNTQPLDLVPTPKKQFCENNTIAIKILILSIKLEHINCTHQAWNI